MTRPEEALGWLFARQRMGMTLGLERIRALLRALGAPQDSFRSVLVGGTNGKGSTARALAECLGAAGPRTGLFTSPHLSRVGERFLVDGREPGSAELAAVVQELRPAAEEVGASFFEAVTAAACLFFARQGIQWAVMEVGLGGRFDATNALEPELSVITGVALDHVDLLGPDVASIAAEKAGILRPFRPALTGAHGAALNVVQAEAALLGADLWVLGREVVARVESLGWHGLLLEVACPAGTASGRSPLVGGHQGRNLALAAAAALRLGVDPAAVSRGLAATRWPGRLELLQSGGHRVVLDGAHNADAAAALAASLAELGAVPHALVIGAGSDKDLEAIAAALKPGASRVYATRATYSPRARPPAEVAAAFGNLATTFEVPTEALAAAMDDCPPERGTVLVAGSLYLVGELRAHLLGEPYEPVERWQ